MVLVLKKYANGIIAQLNQARELESKKIFPFNWEIILYFKQSKSCILDEWIF